MKRHQSRAYALMLVLFLFLLVTIVTAGLYSSYTEFTEDSDNQAPSTVVIAKGKDLRQLAGELYTQGIIKDPASFVFWVRLYGNAGKIKAGEYAIPPYASPMMVMKIIISAETVVRRVTFKEGMTSEQIIEELLNAYGLEGDVQEIPPNGTLMPNTYHYSLGDTRQSIVKRMAESMQKKTAEIWEKRAKNLPFSTLEEAITLASIVEKETSVASERPLIASVFVNRLRKGMRLQSDPTVIYAITDGKYDLKRKLLYKDLRVSHPYNTYTNYGIPPSPICNPGSESIEAVLNPADTDYLYFVANNKGGHSFSNNYRQHTNNVNKLRKKIKAKKDAAKTKNVQEKAKKTEVKPAPGAQKNVYPEIKPKPEIVK